MISPGFIDLLFFLVLAAFVVKGWITGFIRSVITLLAVIGGWVLSGMVPLLTSPVLHYSIPLSSPYHPLACRITTFIIMFGLVQAAGFVITGLIENIRIGTLDKFVGLCLGVVTAVVASSLILSIFYTYPRVYWAVPVQKYQKASVFFKAYTPIVRKFARVPHRPADDESDS